MTAYERVLISRDNSRPTAIDFINQIFSGFIEFHGDRAFMDDKAVVGGLAFLEEQPVTLIGIQKGHTLEENIARNFGSPHPEGYRKALRLMKQAEKFSRPVIIFINTSGAYPGVGAEERGQGEAIAKNLLEMSALKTPVISIIVGEGCSGGALAVAVADRVWMLQNAVYSILSPEGFASILWKDSSRAREAASLMRITAEDMLSLGVIEKILPELDECIVDDFCKTADNIKNELISELSKIQSLDINTLLNQRYERFRKIGDFIE